MDKNKILFIFVMIVILFLSSCKPKEEGVIDLSDTTYQEQVTVQHNPPNANQEYRFAEGLYLRGDILSRERTEEGVLITLDLNETQRTILVTEESEIRIIRGPDHINHTYDWSKAFDRPGTLDDIMNLDNCQVFYERTGNEYIANKLELYIPVEMDFNTG